MKADTVAAAEDLTHHDAIRAGTCASAVGSGPWALLACAPAHSRRAADALGSATLVIAAVLVAVASRF